MKAFSIAAMTFIMFLGLLNNALSQPSVANAAGAETPEWLVWREFHASLEFYEKQSPAATAELLQNRIGLGDTKRFAFMNAGRAYLQQLDAIDKDARLSIAGRYKDQLESRPQTQSPGTASPKDLLRVDVGGPMGELLPGTTRDGRTLLDVLRADGFLNEVEAQKRAALEGHLDTLDRSFGNDVLAKVEMWIAVEVAPKIAVDSDVDRGSPVSESVFGDHIPASR